MTLTTRPPVAPRVLVTRPADQAVGLLSALRRFGARPVLVPTITIDLDTDRAAVDAAATDLGRYAWIVVTSANGARAILEAATRAGSAAGAARWAAIGPATAAVLEKHGLVVSFQPGDATGPALGSELPVRNGEPVLLVRGDLADDRLPDALRSRGVAVTELVAYRTREGPAESSSLLRDAIAGGPFAAIVLTSGSTARGLAAIAGDDLDRIVAVPAVCIGRESAREAERLGFTILAIPGATDPDAIASATVAALADFRPETP